MVPEFARVVSYTVPALPATDHKRRLLRAVLDAPAGSKLLSSTRIGGASGDLVPVEDLESPTFRILVGVYHSKQEFCRLALSAPHPFDSMDIIPDILKTRLFEAAERGPDWVRLRRTAVLKEWLSLAASLEDEERRLQKSLDPGVKGVLKGKRTLLLEALAARVGWPDQGVFESLRSGFELVGSLEHTGVFAKDLRPGSDSVGSFVDSFKFLKPALLGKVASSRCGALEREVWDKTLEEVQEGFLSGPFREEEVDSMLGPAWVPVRRFGVEQSSAGKRKVRPVDDYSENRVNSAFSYCDRIDLRALDELVASCRLWTRFMLGGGPLEVALSDGTILRGRLHPSWSSSRAWQPLVATLDLRSAYKQVPLAPSNRAFSVVSLKDPESSLVSLFVGRSLPFGSTSSVINFNRLSRLLWRLGNFLFWSNYYDDYPVVTPAALADSTRDTMLTFMRLVKFDTAEEKLNPFSPSASVLGIEIDCSASPEGWVDVRNKDGRAGEVCVGLELLLQEGFLLRRDLPRILGRIQFADAQVLGKAGRHAMKEIRNWSSSHSADVLRLDDVAKRSFRVLLDRFRASRPVRVPCSVAPEVMHVFTDGSSEGRNHFIGGILFSSLSGPTRFFACEVPATLAERWQSDMMHIIGPVETYAVAVARCVWEIALKGCRCVYYIDNYGALDAFIKGFSSNAYMSDILLSFEQRELSGPSWPWFTRVPSESNCADDPSRAQFSHLVSLGVLRDKGSCPVLGCELGDLSPALSKVGEAMPAQFAPVTKRYA